MLKFEHSHIFQAPSRYECIGIKPVYYRMCLYVLVCYSYVVVCYSNVLVCYRLYWYVTRMYSCFTRMLLVFTPMCLYVTRMLLVCYSCFTRMLLVFTPMYLYVTRMYSCGGLVTALYNLFFQRFQPYKSGELTPKSNTTTFSLLMDDK